MTGASRERTRTTRTTTVTRLKKEAHSTPMTDGADRGEAVIHPCTTPQEGEGGREGGIREGEEGNSGRGRGRERREFLESA